MNLKIFETPRLRIRPSVWDDVETFFQWEQQPAVTEFFSIHHYIAYRQYRQHNLLLEHYRYYTISKLRLC